jgi:hypothetical protein
MDSNYFRLLASMIFQQQRQRVLLDSPIESLQTDSPENYSREHLSSTSLNQGYYQKFFREEQRIGRGFRGSVFLCKHVIDNVILGNYAVKKIAVGKIHVLIVSLTFR